MKIYMSDIQNMLDLAGAELLEERRRTHMQRYLRIEDQARCLTAGLMLRAVLGEERAALVQRSHLGKPYLPGGPCFNLSHSGSKVVLAADERDVGIDIEQILPPSDTVARRVFTPREYSWLKLQDCDAAFFRLWTGKEAIMKALGLGFQLPPERFEILPASIGPNPVGDRNWFLRWQEADGHIFCTASERPDAPEAIISLTREQLLAH